MLEAFTIPNFKVYYRAITIKIVSYWHKKQKGRLVDQNRRCIHKPMHLQPTDLQQRSSKIQWRKDILFNKCCWENWITTCRRLKLDTCLSPCTKINSKWIEELWVGLEL
jgi:hypothetical protein